MVCFINDFGYYQNLKFVYNVHLAEIVYVDANKSTSSYKFLVSSKKETPRHILVYKPFSDNIRQNYTSLALILGE